jgi:hypothetical protein
MAFSMNNVSPGSLSRSYLQTASESFIVALVYNADGELQIRTLADCILYGDLLREGCLLRDGDCTRSVNLLSKL